MTRKKNAFISEYMSSNKKRNENTRRWEVDDVCLNYASSRRTYQAIDKPCVWESVCVSLSVCERAQHQSPYHLMIVASIRTHWMQLSSYHSYIASLSMKRSSRIHFALLDMRLILHFNPSNYDTLGMCCWLLIFTVITLSFTFR